MDMPRLGFGTYGRTGPDGIAAILSALEVGYRHLDTAQTYDTESEVGEAIRRSGLPRQDVFVTTKVAEENLGSGQVIPSLEQSLAALGLDYLDLALIHWPARKGGPAPFTGPWYRYCETRYRSFNPETGTYQPSSGPRRLCR